MTLEFTEFDKISRLNREVIVTEKIDGTNGQVHIRLANPIDFEPPKDPGAVGYYEIASLDFGFDEPFESQQHANARLIAAAPELLKAIRELVTAVDHVNWDCTRSAEYGRLYDVRSVAQAVIAKVEGRS